MSDEGINVVSDAEGVFYNGRKYEPGVYQDDHGRALIVRRGGGVTIKGSAHASAPALSQGDHVIGWMTIAGGVACVALLAILVYVFVVMAMRVPS